MRNLKKILALVLALMMVLSVMVTASAASPLEKYADKDSITPAYEQAVEVMTAAGVFSGNGTDFEPGRVLTRAEAATLVTVLATGGEIAPYKAKCETNFDDVTATHWASGFITYCYDNGLILGTSATTYEPTLELSYEQYAAMLLRVLGVDCTTAGKWYVPVRNNATKLGLMKGIEGYTWTAGLTREAACQMTFNAMGYGATTTATGKYVIEVGTIGDDLIDTFVAYTQGLTFNSIPEAVTYVDALNLYAFKLGSHYNVVAETTSTSGLMDAFGIAVKASANGGKDAYGRPALVYTVDQGKDADGKDIEDVVLAYAEAPVAIYTTKMDAVAAAAAAKALSESKYTVDARIYFTQDGVSKDSYRNSYGVASLLQQNTGNNVVIELYAGSDKVIDTAVITNTYVDTVKSVDKGDAAKKIPASIILTKGGKVETEGYIVGEVVTYTLCGSTVENLAKADYIMGTLTSYNSKGEYTIEGKTYTLDGVSASTVQGQFGKAYVYYLGANNTIIATAEKLPSADAPSTPVAPTVDGYAMVSDAIVRVTATAKTELNAWTGAYDVVGYDIGVVALVKTLNNEADEVAYALEVKQAAKADTTKGLAKGDYYVEYAGETVVLFNASALTGKTTAEEIKTVVDSASTAATAAVKADLVTPGYIYTYNTADGAINLIASLALMNGSENKDGETYRSVPATIGSSTLYVTYGSGQTVLFNENTIFVLKDTDTKNTTDTSDDVVSYVVKTGVAALEATDDLNYANGAKMVISVTTTLGEDGKTVDTSKNVYTAKIVFAQNVEFDKAGSAPATETEEYVYVDASSYVVTKSEDGKKDIYTYVAKKVDGSAISVTYNEALASTASGIYVLKTDGSLGTAKDTGVATTVGTIAGTTVKLDSYVIVNSTTTVVGELATGAQVYYVMGENNVVDTIFVAKAAQ